MRPRFPWMQHEDSIFARFSEARFFVPFAAQERCAKGKLWNGADKNSQNLTKKTPRLSFVERLAWIQLFCLVVFSQRHSTANSINSASTRIDTPTPPSRLQKETRT